MRAFFLGLIFVALLPAAKTLDVYFVDDTTAGAGLNNYVYTLKEHWFASTNVHSHPKQDETQRRLTAIEAVC